MTLAPRRHCSGCSACHDACPKGAIRMIADDEGFLYPEIDSSRCVNCGLCARACPSLNRPAPRTPLAVYAAKANDTALRLASSSGGIFSLLARQILAKGGKVFGAAFDKRDWSVEHIGVSDESGLAELRGSKYVQSSTAGIYREVKSALEANLPVLFTGTPCQIAALRAYLNLQPSTSTSNLYLVEVICHGAPSPKVWQTYLASLGVAPKLVTYRDKSTGWKRYSISIEAAKGCDYTSPYPQDPYMIAFLRELCNRLSCHDCQVRELRSGSDLTIADFWGIQDELPAFDDDRGASLVLVNTEKGAAFFQELSDAIESAPSSFEVAAKHNSALVRSPAPNPRRARFLSRVTPSNFAALARKLTRPTWLARLRPFLGRLVRKLGLRK